MADLSGRDLVWLERRRAELYGLIARVGDFRRGALNLSGALLADCSAEGAQIINSAPIQAASRWEWHAARAVPVSRGRLVLQPDVVTCAEHVLDAERPPLDDHGL